MAAERGPDSRTWENTYEVEVLDPDTGQPTGETKTEQSRYYEKATNLCYNTLIDSEPAWVPAVPVFQPSEEVEGGFAVTQAQVQVSLSPNLGVGNHVSYKVDGLSMGISLEGLGFYEKSTDRLIVFQQPFSSNPVKVSDNTIRYPGVFPGCDVDYEYGLTEFKQLVRFSTPGGASDPALWGLNPDDTLLVVVSNIDVEGTETGFVNSTAGLNLEMREEESSFELKRGNSPICRFAPGYAWDDGEGPLDGAPVYKAVLSQDGAQKLVEGVPYKWIMSEDRQFPLTLDYVIERSGSASGSEVWREGNTYYVSGFYVLTAGDELVIEPGTVIKIGANAGISANGNGKITAQGTKFNYIIITSAKDNDSDEGPGEPIKSVSGEDKVEVIGYEHRAQEEIKRTYVEGSGETPRNSAHTDEILLVLTFKTNSIELTDSDYIDLKINNGDTVRAYLPSGTYTVSSGDVILPLWVAEEGSTFWGRRSPSPYTNASPDQDAVYAMRFGSNRPARSANASGTLDNPAVDEGSAGSATAYSTTSTDGTQDTSNSDNLDLGYHYNGGVTP